MDPLKVLKPQTFVFKAFGLWSDNRNVVNQLHIAFAFYFISIGFIITLFSSILLVGSMKEVIDNLIVTNSTILAFLKGIVFYIKYSKHLQIFGLIEKLDKSINPQSNVELKIMENFVRIANQLSGGFTVCYGFAWIFLAIQSIFGSSDQVFWSSTALYPGEISQNRTIYWFVFVFQGFSTLVLVIATFACDTYGIIVTMILTNYIDILSSRLRNLGTSEIKPSEVGRASTTSHSTADVSLELTECVKTFYTCLR